MTEAEAKSFDLAKREISKNLSLLMGKHLIEAKPQANDLMALRNTNEKNPGASKWIVYLPFDYI